MSMSSFVALRYTTSGRKNRFFSWITWLSIAGIAIGIATMIVVRSVIDGFEDELRNRFLNANAHILAFRYPDGLTNIEDWTNRFKNDFNDEIIGVSPFVHFETMAKSKAIMHSVLVRGFDPDLRETVQSIKTAIEPSGGLAVLQNEIKDFRLNGKIPDIPHVIVGEGVLKILNIKIGDQIKLISPNSGDFSQIGIFKVSGVYHAGLKHYDNRLIAMSITTAQHFFNMDDRVTGLEVGMNDPYKSVSLASRMSEKYSLTIKEWQSFNKPVFQALETERIVIFTIVLIIAIVAGFNILTTLFIAVTLKQKEISILKALGARNTQIMSLFLKQGSLFGICGSILGVLMALGISFAIEQYQFIDLPDPYFLTNLPMTYDWKVYLGISTIGVLICLVMGVIPALTAAMLTPSEGFRGAGKATWP